MILSRYQANDPPSETPELRVSVECPLCASSQEESPRAVSTFCRSCGEHYGIEGGRAIAPREPAPLPRFRSTDDEATDSNSPPPENNRGLPFESACGVPDSSGINAGPIPKHSIAFVRKLLNMPGGSSAPRTIECPDCGRPLQVSEAASSTICSACSSYIRVEDVLVEGHFQRSVRTRGDLIVHRKGSLFCRLIDCRNLRARGAVSGEIRCQEDAVFSADCQVTGPVKCRRLVVGKNVQVEFMSPVVVESMEIYGYARGSFECSQSARISRRGILCGKLSAAALSIEPGGVLEGAFQVTGNSPDSIPAASAGAEA